MKNKRAFSLIELMIAISIVIFLAFMSIRASRDVLRQSNVVSYLMAIKASIQKARGDAMAYGMPVIVRIDNGQIAALGDSDRDGAYGEEQKDLVVGESLATPVTLEFTKVSLVLDSDSRIPPLDHWTGLVSGIGNFPNQTFYITPAGHVFDETKSPAQGAFFVVSEDDEFAGALFLSALGEARMAFREKGATAWTWSD